MTGRGPSVLVVDDEPRVCTILVKLLSSRGYVVTTTVRPQEALARVEGGERYQVAILDVVMPDMPGDELARALRRHQPDLKILFLSGFPEVLVQTRPMLWVGEAFLEKPFTANGLFGTLSTLLAGE